MSRIRVRPFPAGLIGKPLPTTHRAIRLCVPHRRAASDLLGANGRWPFHARESAFGFNAASKTRCI
jgi:hypothetical protein